MDHINLLSKLASLLSHSETDALSALTTAVPLLIDAMQCGFAVIYRLDPESNTLKVRSAFRVPEPCGLSPATAGSIVFDELVVQKRRYVYFADLHKIDHASTDPDLNKIRFRSIFGVPVRVDGKIVGAFSIFNFEPRHFEPLQVDILNIAANLIAQMAVRQYMQDNTQIAHAHDHAIYEVLEKAVRMTEDSFIDDCLQRIADMVSPNELGIFWYDTESKSFTSHAASWFKGQVVNGGEIIKQDLYKNSIVWNLIQGDKYYFSHKADSIPGQFFSDIFNDKDVASFLLVGMAGPNHFNGIACLSWAKGAQKLDDACLHRVLSIMNTISLWRSLKKRSQNLRESLSLINYMFDKAPVPIYQINLRTQRFTRVNEQVCRVSGYTEQELINMNPIDFLTPSSRIEFDRVVEELIFGRFKPPSIEFEIRTKSGELEWGHFQFYHIFKNGELWGANVAVHMITEQKRAREELAAQGRKLEALVAERTSELSMANQKLREEVVRRTETAKELRLKSERLKELNTAMRVLLDKRSEDRLRSEENIRVNLVQLIEPYLDRLHNSGITEEQRQLLDVIKMNLVDVVGEPMPELSAKYYIFSPTELQVANLIRNGKTTKDIARMLSLSPRTVESYRNSIRKKLGLKNKKVNLKTFLSFKE